MAAGWRVLTSRATVELIGDQDTADVIEVWIETAPSHVRYKLYVPDNEFTASIIQGLAESYSPLFEQARHFHGVQELYPRQDVNQAGNLVENMVFALASDDGRITADFVQPEFVIPTWVGLADLVAAEVAKLNQIAAL
jgi:hypothetical protein